MYGLYGDDTVVTDKQFCYAGYAGIIKVNEMDNAIETGFI